MTALPAALRSLGLSPAAEAVLAFLRWPLLAGILTAGLAMLYRFAPSREKPRWRWATWGAGAATAVWLTASLLFTWYLARFNDLNETYGVLGAVIILLLWSQLGAYAAMAGASLNAEMERQTAHDTTE